MVANAHFLIESICLPDTIFSVELNIINWRLGNILQDQDKVVSGSCPLISRSLFLTTKSY